MQQIIEKPTIVKAQCNIPKIIKEFIGRKNTDNKQLSIAKMESPAGWSEPGQTPDFDEYTIVLKGTVKIETKEKTFEVNAGSAFCTSKGKWVRYSTPNGAEYISVCVPAFKPETVHRDVQ
ncbi:MAG: cupin [Proteobacteria bacterium]|nr:cupin [Pseudomonadota bacterium]